jgi:tetratricopeptide (TPR) repeat protein
MRGELSGSSIGYYPVASIKSEVLKAFETHLEDYPGDWYSRREYAIALMWDQQYERGAQVLLACYQADPTLVRIAFDENLFGVGSSDLGVLSQNLVRFARRNDSPESWFAMSVILQGKGNYAHALLSLERAKELGFDKELVQSMETSLRASASGIRG